VDRGDRHFSGHVPALDGVRAIAVAAVLVFHADLHGVLPGGFLGVSVFFTLSGFLITSLLVREHSESGRIDLGAFYTRRVKRLVAVVLSMGVLWGATQRGALPGDAVAAVANVANWRFAFATRSYQDLFLGLPSPLAHFWSLAIEEQCYLVLPLVVWWSLRTGRGRGRLTLVLGALVAGSVVATLLTHDLNLVYNGTHTRAAELLVGSLAALAYRRWRLPRRAQVVLAILGLATLGVLVQSVDLRTHWLYRGGFPLVAVASAALILGLMGDHSLARIVGARPLVAVGRVSYGVYLFHWPVYLALTRARVGVGGFGLLAVRLAVTAMVVVYSYRWVEMPVRTGGRWAGRARPTMAMAATAAVLMIAAVVVVPAPHFTATQRLLAQGTDAPLAFPASAAGFIGTTAAQRVPQPTVLVLGSEVALVHSLSVLPFHVVDGTQPDCPVVPAVEAHFLDGRVVDASSCESPLSRWPRLLADSHPDVVVVTSGVMETAFTRDASDPPLPLVDAAHLGALGPVLQRAEDRLRTALVPVLASNAMVVLYDAANAPNGESLLGRLALQSTSPVHVGRSVADVFTIVSSAAVSSAAASSASGARPASSAGLRLLVVGDSTSLDVASALSQGSDGRLDVLWAGANGCPFARAAAARPDHHGDWIPLHCDPFDRKLPPLLRDFRPDSVLLVVGPMEFQELRMADDPVGHVAGEPAFTSEHDAEMAAFRSVIGNLPLVVADAPTIRAGAWATPEMADPTRATAWNDLVTHWTAVDPRVRMLHYAAALTAYEATHGNIRTDGVHPEIGPLTDLARAVLVDQVLALAR
jgi:peptidoglycan/LPS O-acetylase OafA/YrhL